MNDRAISALLGGDLIELAPGEEFWRLATVTAIVGLSKSEIYRRASEGTFPKSRKYQSGAAGDRGAFWLASEIRRWQHQEVNCMAQKW